MRQRIISAAIGIAALIAILYLHGVVLDMAVIVLSIAGMLELYRAFALKGAHIALFISIPALLIMAAAVAFLEMQYLFFIVIIFFMVCMAIPIFTAQYSFADVQATAFSLLYPSIGFIFIIALNHILAPLNLIMIIGTMLFTWGCDSGAYFTGYWLGRHLLCPRISPKKTIEGSIGGILISIALGILYGVIVQTLVYEDIMWYNYVIIALLVGFISQIGDLAASVIKRYYGIKDFGRFMPGHGGVLDRFDSILFTAPVVYIYAMVLLRG